MFKPPTVPEEVIKYQEPIDLDALTAGMNLKKLNQIFQSVIKKQEDKTDPIRSKFGKIEKEEVSMDEKMAYLENYASTHKEFGFRELLECQKSKTEVIVTFLSVLELMKTGKIEVVQKELFDEIWIRSRCVGKQNGIDSRG